MITRNELYRILNADNQMENSLEETILIHRSLSDEMLAAESQLTVVRKGYFTIKIK
jgi:hypothetical protein